MRTITVYMSDGDTITTDINGTDEEIARHYLGRTFEAGSDTKHHVALAVLMHDTGRRIGLKAKNIESGEIEFIHSVRFAKTMIHGSHYIPEVFLGLADGNEFALSDVWIYDMNGEWIRSIGYKHPTA